MAFAGDLARKRKKEKEERKEKQFQIDQKKLTPANQRSRAAAKAKRLGKISTQDVATSKFKTLEAKQITRSDFQSKEAFDKAISTLRAEAKRDPLTSESKKADILKAAAEEKAGMFLEEQEAFEETRPEEVQLDIKEGQVAPEKLPITGPITTAVVGVLNNAAQKGWFPKEIFGGAEETLIQNPETLRELAKQEIQQEVIDEGLSLGESFGALVESIPVVGKLVANYANGLIETPGGNVKTITTEVGKIGQRATNMREKALTGKMGDPYIAYDQIVKMEKDIAKMEQRIKLLALSSATLQSDADTLNLIQETILDAKQRIFDAKQSATTGIIQDPTDSSLYLDLQRFKEKIRK